jgi:hypothetical protein
VAWRDGRPGRVVLCGSIPENLAALGAAEVVERPANEAS